MFLRDDNQIWVKYTPGFNIQFWHWHRGPGYVETLDLVCYS